METLKARSERLETFLASKHSCGKLSLRDDPFLLRLTVKSEKEPSEELKNEIRQLFRAYSISWEKF